LIYRVYYCTKDRNSLGLENDLEIEQSRFLRDGHQYRGLTPEFANSTLESMNRPPPYFPQNQLSPPDENRYRKFKLMVAGAIIVLILVLAGLGIGIYYLIRSFV